MKEYEKKTKEELLDIIFKLTSSNTAVRAYEAYKKQIDKMVELLEQTDLATVHSLSDKDEKKWDRGKVLFEKLPNYIRDLKDMEAQITEVKSRYVKEAETGSYEDDFEKYNKKSV